MQKHMPRKQLNNEGFSLVELLIAIVILSIIVVPLLHSFVTSARTNAKSRSTMHATAIAEDIMEMFEAHSLEEMADIYTAETPAGFTNTADTDDTTGIWTYTIRDDSTTSGTYDAVIKVDPTAYSAVNSVERVDIQNLAGNLNAVYSEAADAAMEAYSYFGGGVPTADIVQNTTRKIEINIDSSKTNVTLATGEVVETEVYLVTASATYHCDSSLLANGRSADYPQTGADYVIFSNEDSVRSRAAQVNDASELGNQLANIIVCVQPRVESAHYDAGRPAIVDRVVINNPDDVETNLLVVEQEPTQTREDMVSDLYGTDYASMRMKYGISLEVREAWPGWMPTAGTTQTSAGKLRTNLLGRSEGLTAYVFENSSMTGAGAGTGLDYELAKKILSVTDLTPTTQKDRIYDIEVKIYAEGKIADGRPIITMTGNVTE